MFTKLFLTLEIREESTNKEEKYFLLREKKSFCCIKTLSSSSSERERERSSSWEEEGSETWCKKKSFCWINLKLLFSRLLTIARVKKKNTTWQKNIWETPKNNKVGKGNVFVDIKKGEKYSLSVARNLQMIEITKYLDFLKENNEFFINLFSKRKFSQKKKK